jgi:hypothetical protein
MTDNFPGDTAMLETTIALSGSTAACERLPMNDAPLLDRLNRPRAASRAGRSRAIRIQTGLGTHARLVADRPGDGSRFSAAKSLSSNTSADPHARIFGLSLAALLAACLVLNAGSPSTRICQLSDRDFAAGADPGTASTRVVPALGGASHVERIGTIRSKECATYQGGEEPGY